MGQLVTAREALWFLLHWKAFITPSLQPGAHERAKYAEHLAQHMLVEHHFSQVDQPMSKFGMHFYGMGGRLYTSKVWPTFRVYNRLPIPSKCIPNKDFVWSLNCSTQLDAPSCLLWRLMRSCYNLNCQELFRMTALKIVACLPSHATAYWLSVASDIWPL